MFDFLTLNFEGLGNKHPATQTPTTPINVLAEKTLSTAVDITVGQFNNACEKVCYDQTEKFK